MKNTVFLIVLLPFTHVFGQNNIALNDIYFTRQPSPISESLGKGGVALFGNKNFWFYNPALLGTIDRISISGALIDPGFYGINGQYNSFSLAVPFSTRFGIGFGRFFLDWQHGSYSVNYAISASYQPLSGLYVGGSMNYVRDYWTSSFEAQSFPLDLGIAKFWRFSTPSANHTFIAAVSYRNVFEAQLRYPKNNAIILDSLPLSFQTTFDLPTIQNFGVSYVLTTNKTLLDLTALSWLAMIDLTNVKNTKYYGGYHIGSELTAMEILAIRCGYYREKNYKSKYEKGPTYGLGIQVPIYKITENRVPLLVSMSHTRFSWGGDNSRKLTAWSLSIDWNRR